jgi:hypothetical protein
MALPHRAFRFVVLSFGLATALGLSSCGGGFFIGDGIDVEDPDISLIADTSTVIAGDSVKLTAAAADSGGIDEVAFYRLDNGAATRLGSDGRSPYEWTVQAPDDGRTTLQVFARATDEAGNTADSATLTITIEEEDDDDDD